MAAEGVQISTDLTQLLGMHRATYQLWKREPSKISWGVVDEFATDLVVLRSALIIGLSTLPGRIVDGLVGLAYPSHYWEVLGNATGMAIVFMLAVVGATWLRHRLHPVITRQEAWSEPSSRQKSLRAITRLLHATVLAVLLFIASLLSLRVATAGRTFLIVVAMAAAGAVAYTLLKGILQELFMPWNPGQRLITCRDSIAGFLYTHLRRISLYAAVGLTLIYGVLKFGHFAHGDSMMLAAFISFFFLHGFIIGSRPAEEVTILPVTVTDLPGADEKIWKFSFGYGMWIAIALSAVVVAAMFIAIERVVLPGCAAIV